MLTDSSTLETPQLAAVSDAAALATLARPDAAMVDVLQALATLDASSQAFRTLKVGIAANVTVDLLPTYLRRHAYGCGVRMQAAAGNYDDLPGDAAAHRQTGVDLLLMLPFFDNLQAGWETRLATLSESERSAVQQDSLARLDQALKAAAGVGQVLVLGAHAWNPATAEDGVAARALADFNAGLQTVVARHPNARVLPTAGLLAQLGMAQGLDARFYFRGKSPWTAVFVDALARRIASATRGFGSRFHKVLVLDCDNTLWGGTVGEDGPGGIALDPHGFPGNVFWTVQQQLLALQAQGVLLCLCSKNNAADVDEVLARHPHMALRAEKLVARKVNWQDKPSNLRALAAELNLGLDSFVFVDDSLFEVQAVREQLPQVRVFQVPKALPQYPALMREVSALFVDGGLSDEGRAKTQQYRALAEAASQQATYASHDDYLRSLRLRVTLTRNCRQDVTRIAELMAKSNQFNLTTLRLPAGELLALMDSAEATVYAFTVSDRLTEHGLTGVLVTRDDSDTVQVTAFLMSCRVIGRGVEFAVWRRVLADAQARGMRGLQATYLATTKNAQVADFYDRLGLPLLAGPADAEGASVRHYAAQLAGLQLADSAWVELQDGDDDEGGRRHSPGETGDGLGAGGGRGPAGR